MRATDQILEYLDGEMDPTGIISFGPEREGPLVDPSAVMFFPKEIPRVPLTPPMGGIYPGVHEAMGVSRTALDDMRLGDATLKQLRDYTACRRVLEEHLDEETVFDELCRLAMQSDDETTDAFAALTNEDEHLAQKLSIEVAGGPQFANIALGMLRDGWAEHQVRYALTTLGALDD